MGLGYLLVASEYLDELWEGSFEFEEVFWGLDWLVTLLPPVEEEVPDLWLNY